MMKTATAPNDDSCYLCTRRGYALCGLCRHAICVDHAWEMLLRAKRKMHVIMPNNYGTSLPQQIEVERYICSRCLLQAVDASFTVDEDLRGPNRHAAQDE